MQKLINLLSEYIATLPGFLFLVLILLLCLSVFSWRTNQLKLETEGESKLLDSRFWYTPKDVQEFFDYIDTNAGKVGLNLYALTQVTLDFIFPIAYGLLFTALLFLLHGSKVDWRLTIPIIAIFADFGENFTLAYLAKSHNRYNSPSPLAWLAYICTLTKWAMSFASLFLILIGFVFWVISDSWRISSQYIFWLRVPIIFGLILYFSPIVANTIAAKLIQNLFVIRGRWQLIAVMISSTMAALMVSLTLEAIIENAPARFIEISSFVGASSINITTLHRYLLALVLLLPTWSITLWLSMEISLVIKEKKYLLNNRKIQEDRKIISELYSLINGEKKIVSGFFWGLGASFVLGMIVHIGGATLRFLLDTYQVLENIIAKIINYVTLGYSQGYMYSNKIAEQHLLGLSLVLIGLLGYLVIGYLYKPGQKHIPIIQNIIKDRETPALMYALFLIWIAAGVFGGITFYLDLFSIPVIVFVTGISALGYFIFNVDHYFKLQKLENSSGYQAKQPVEEFATAIENRLSKQPPEQGRTLVVVAASGGGIQASGWTAQVLGGLQEDLGLSFTQATGLISSVSGGSVGTMYFLDNFDNIEGHPVPQNEDETEKNCIDENCPKFQNQALNNTFCNATEDWLDAVGWGLAYPDLFRFTGWLSFLVRKYNDRGYALERDWQIKMRHPRVEKTLTDWREKSIKGEIPIPVFNATLVEDGRRFLISPMKFVEGEIEDLINSDNNRKVLDFRTLYKDYDLNVTTAARLSATFPYVSPLPRNDPGICIDLSDSKKFYGNYHFADGGYFDNSGLFTAVEWIDRGLESFLKDAYVKRILLVEINASPVSQTIKGSKGIRQWFTQSIGPLKTAYAVRDSTLVARNLKEAELLIEKWQGDVDIEHSVISFPENYNQPLSWRLTKQQKKNLKLAWQDVKQTSNFKELKKIWHETWKIPHEWKTSKEE